MVSYAYLTTILHDDRRNNTSFALDHIIQYHTAQYHMYHTWNLTVLTDWPLNRRDVRDFSALTSQILTDPSIDPLARNNPVCLHECTYANKQIVIPTSRMEGSSPYSV